MSNWAPNPGPDETYERGPLDPDTRDFHCPPGVRSLPDMVAAYQRSLREASAGADASSETGEAA